MKRLMRFFGYVSIAEIRNLINATEFSIWESVELYKTPKEVREFRLYIVYKFNLLRKYLRG